MDNFIEFLYSKFLQSDGVSIDTRTITKNNLFFAITGPNFNGNQYALKALEAGAAFAVVDQEAYVTDERILLSPFSGLETLQRLAAFHRSRFKQKVIAITGSNGKTTSKELIARVLAKKYHVHATKGNLNNHLGVPLTLLQVHPQIEVVVVEMGANHVGEIADLCAIAKPDFGLITNIGEAHTETFGGIEGVLRGKSELFDFLKKSGGTPIINTLDFRLENMAKRFGNAVLFPSPDLKLLSADPYIRIELGDKQMKTEMVGAYNFGNMAAAVAVGRIMEVSEADILEAVATYKPENQRSQIIKKNNVQIIVDCYNANPTSMKAAIENLKNMSGKRAVILGDMKEVENAEMKHQEIGAQVLAADVAIQIFVGENMKYAHEQCSESQWFSTVGDLIENGLEKISFAGSTVLVKASRSMGLEKVVEHIGKI
jgi:UDP-N-acetylmuramoyl-tripeptide--D-alanyl-D-alanine ligase